MRIWTLVVESENKREYMGSTIEIRVEKGVDRLADFVTVPVASTRSWATTGNTAANIERT